MALFNKKNLSKTHNKYGISKKDMINDINDFPVGVVVRMMEECEMQGGKPNVHAFQNNVCEGDPYVGGFDWGATEDGSEFWATVSLYNFDLFFEKYPEYEKYN